MFLFVCILQAATSTEAKGRERSRSRERAMVEKKEEEVLELKSAREEIKKKGKMEKLEMELTSDEEQMKGGTDTQALSKSVLGTILCEDSLSSGDKDNLSHFVKMKKRERRDAVSSYVYKIEDMAENPEDYSRRMRKKNVFQRRGKSKSCLHGAVGPEKAVSAETGSFQTLPSSSCLDEKPTMAPRLSAPQLPPRPKPKTSSPLHLPPLPLPPPPPPPPPPQHSRRHSGAARIRALAVSMPPVPRVSELESSPSSRSSLLASVRAGSSLKKVVCGSAREQALAPDSALIERRRGDVGRDQDRDRSAAVTRLPPPPPPPQSSGLTFGGEPPPPPQSSGFTFGGGPAPPPKSSGLTFGGAPPPPPPQSSGLTFGGAPPPPPQSSGLTFGGGPPPPPQSSGLTFRSAPLPPPSPMSSGLTFGGAPPPPPPQSSGLTFGGAPPPPPPLESSGLVFRDGLPPQPPQPKSSELNFGDRSAPPPAASKSYGFSFGGEPELELVPQSAKFAIMSASQPADPPQSSRFGPKHLKAVSQRVSLFGSFSQSANSSGLFGFATDIPVQPALSIGASPVAQCIQDKAPISTDTSLEKAVLSTSSKEEERSTPLASQQVCWRKVGEPALPKMRGASLSWKANWTTTEKGQRDVNRRGFSASIAAKTAEEKLELSDTTKDGIISDDLTTKITGVLQKSKKKPTYLEVKVRGKPDNQPGSYAEDLLSKYNEETAIFDPKSLLMEEAKSQMFCAEEKQSLLDDCMDIPFQDTREQGTRKVFFNMRVKRMKEKRSKDKQSLVEALTEDRSILKDVANMESDFGIGVSVPCVRQGLIAMPVENITALLKLQKGKIWEFGPDLDSVLNIQSDVCRDLLYKAGLKSLGSSVAEDILHLLATILSIISILEVICPKLFPLSMDKIAKLGDDDEAAVDMKKSMIRLLTSHKMDAGEVLKAVDLGYKFCHRVDQQHPLVCNSLELGANWVTVASQLLGLHWVK